MSGFLARLFEPGRWYRERFNAELKEQLDFLSAPDARGLSPSQRLRLVVALARERAVEAPPEDTGGGVIAQNVYVLNRHMETLGEIETIRGETADGTWEMSFVKP